MARWAPDEIKILREMTSQGMSADDIFKSGKLPRRTSKAITKQIERLGSFVRQTKSFVGQIKEAKVADLESFVKRYVDAFNKLCELTDYDKEDLERFRLIHSFAVDYPALLAEYERLKQIEEGMEEIRKRLEILEARSKVSQST